MSERAESMQAEAMRLLHEQARAIARKITNFEYDEVAPLWLTVAYDEIKRAIFLLDGSLSNKPISPIRELGRKAAEERQTAVLQSLAESTATLEIGTTANDVLGIIELLKFQTAAFDVEKSVGVAIELYEIIRRRHAEFVKNNPEN